MFCCLARIGAMREAKEAKEAKRMTKKRRSATKFSCYDVCFPFSSRTTFYCRFTKNKDEQNEMPSANRQQIYIYK